MSATKVVNHLRVTHGAADDDEARALIAEAVPHVKAQIVRREHHGGLRPGGPGTQVEIDYEIPATKLREPS